MRLGREKGILAALLLALLLCACTVRGENSAADRPVASRRPDAESSAPIPEKHENDGPEDGLAGRYYNDFLRETLELDGRGGWTLTSGEGQTTGHYTADGSSLMLTMGKFRLEGIVDGDGDLLLAGRSGRYLGNWALWGITVREIDWNQR